MMLNPNYLRVVHSLALLTLGADASSQTRDPLQAPTADLRGPSQVTLYVYEGNNLLHEAGPAANGLRITDTYRHSATLDRHIASDAGDGTVVRHYQLDAFGTPVAMTDNNGDTITRTVYDVWGNTREQVANGTVQTPWQFPNYDPNTNGQAVLLSTDDQSIGFTGYLKDEATGLYYANARWYDPLIGGFNGMDPATGDISRPTTLNKYLYANASPAVFIDPTGKYGIFFDGTWNDDRAKTIAAGGQTNVFKLKELYDGPRDYQIGVGTSTMTKLLGGLTGLGARNRIESAYDKLVTFYNSDYARELRRTNPEQWEKERQIDVLGFSRGSAQALEFAHVLEERGIPNHETGKQFEDVSVRFMGLFDTVGSMVIPGNNINIGYDLTVNPDFVGTVRHATAADEFRRGFPLSSLRESANAELPPGFEERPFRGAHSDTGGGNKTFSQGKLNSLARAPLQWMRDEAVEAGVPFKQIYGDDSAVPDLSQLTEEEARAMLIHDSRTGLAGGLDRLTNRQKRTVFYGNGSRQTISRTEMVRRTSAADPSKAQTVRELPDGGNNVSMPWEDDE